jgi:hypothetical protein
MKPTDTLTFDIRVGAQPSTCRASPWPLWPSGLPQDEPGDAAAARGSSAEASPS